MKIQIAISLIVFISSCTTRLPNESKKINIEGTWVSSKDTCISIEFGKNNLFILNRRCYDNKLMKVGINCDSTSYIIDKVINDSTFVINVNKKECATRYHLQLDFPRIIVTSLKSLPGIEEHFTSPELYIKKDYYDTYTIPDSPLIKIIIPEKFKEEYLYVAFNQIDGVGEIKDKNKNNIIEFPISGLTKTKMIADTKFFAYKNYKVFIRDRNKLIEITTIYHQEYINYRVEFSDEERKVFLKRKKLDLNSKVLVVYRFNPDRKRVVNKIFGEKIIGQVQSFKYLKNLYLNN